MSTHEEVMRDMRRAAGLPVDVRFEEEVVVRPARTSEFALKEIADLSGMNDYQMSEATATPGLDVVAKKDLTSKLKRAVARASKAADSAEKAVSLGRRPEVKSAVAAAYSILDMLRPAISSKELDAIRHMDMDVAKQARMLITGLQKLDREHYGPLAQGASQMSGREVAGKLHDLWSQMDLVARVYNQYRSAYRG